MTFSEAIRQLQAIYSIKLGSLSDALGYDISYLSKWLSGAKLPSLRSAETICERIAAYVYALGDDGNMKAAASCLDFTWVDGQFERALAERLYSLLIEQKNGSAGGMDSDLNAELIPEPSPVSEQIIQKVIQLYRKSRDERIEGVLYMPQDFLSSDGILTANRICALESSSRLLHLRQLVDCESFGGDSDAYVRYILRHMSLKAPIVMEFYPVPKHLDMILPALIIRDGILIQGVELSITQGHQYSLITSDAAIVNECYRVSDVLIQTLPPISEYLDREEIRSSNLPYSYVLQQNNRYLMHDMLPINLSNELLAEFMDKYLDEPEQREYQLKMHEITYGSFNSVVTYKSTLVDYMNSGRIRLFDSVVTLTRDERRRHLTHLIEELEDGEHIAIGIVNDRNPLLDWSDNSMSVFTNENVTFAMDSTQERVNGLYNFTSPEFCQRFGQFYEHLLSLPDTWLKTGKRAIDYIYNGMKLI